jgi:hypothetical protein
MSIETLGQSADQSPDNGQTVNTPGAVDNSGGNSALNSDQQTTTQGDEISDEVKEKIIFEAIEAGRVVDYETRFKPIYGSLKHTERELEAIKKNAGQPGGQQPPAELVKPKPDDFDKYDDYVEALTDYKTDIKLREFSGKQTKEQSADLKEKEAQDNWDNQVTKALAKDPEFIEKSYIPIAMVNAGLLSDTEHLADFAYYFGKNPVEAQKIMAMPIIQAAREIIKLETQFKEPPPKIITNAPGNTRPLTGSTAVGKKPEDMSFAEHVAWRKAGGV